MRQRPPVHCLHLVVYMLSLKIEDPYSLVFSISGGSDSMRLSAVELYRHKFGVKWGPEKGEAETQCDQRRVWLDKQGLTG